MSDLATQAFLHALAQGAPLSEALSIPAASGSAEAEAFRRAPRGPPPPPPDRPPVRRFAPTY